MIPRNRINPFSTLEPGMSRRADIQGKHQLFFCKMGEGAELIPEGACAIYMRLPEGTKLMPLPDLLPAYIKMGYCRTRTSDVISLYVWLEDKSHGDRFRTLCEEVIRAAEEVADTDRALRVAVHQAVMGWEAMLRDSRKKCA